MAQSEKPLAQKPTTASSAKSASSSSASSSKHSAIKAADRFDVAVIGGGVAGLLAAAALRRAGRRVALIEAQDAVGGASRPAQNAFVGAVDNGLKHFPNVPGSEEALRWAEAVVGIDFGMELIEAPATTFDSGRFQPFVGFGDQATLAPEEFAALAAPQHWRLRATPKNWVPALAAQLTDESMPGPPATVFLQSFATKLFAQNQRVEEIVINGAKRIAADKVLFCAPPPALLSLVSTDDGPSAPPARMRQKLSKGDVFTSIHLEIVHGATVTDSVAPHVLRGANEEPCFGVFHPAQESQAPAKASQASFGEAESNQKPRAQRSCQRSQWMMFIPADQTDDSEQIASLLKYVKRQIKRAYETALDHVLYERILVCPQSHGSAQGFLGADRLWPKTRNLRAISSFFAEQRGLTGLLTECRDVTGLLSAGASAEPRPSAKTAEVRAASIEPVGSSAGEAPGVL